MKPNKSLIIQLLLSDMKHEQLLTGLCRLGFESDLHGSNLGKTVAKLLDLPQPERNEEWFELYVKFIEKAASYKITGDGKNLYPLAEAAYTLLAQFAAKRKDP